MDINVIFPIAGKGERFGGTFKPKLIYKGRTFLENAVDSIILDTRINSNLFFICTADQERVHGVVKWIAGLYPKANVIVIPDQTTGPLKTLASANSVLQGELSEQKLPCIICDCDHWLSIKNADIEVLKSEGESITLPLWPITIDEAGSWLVCDSEPVPPVFFEKPKSIELKNIYGVIGCYFFSNTGKFFKKISSVNADSISDYLLNYRNEIQFSFFIPEAAKFFGDPKRLEEQVAKDLFN